MDDIAPANRNGKSNGRHPLNASVLVLNRLYVAVRVVTARRAFTLLFQEHAEAIEKEKDRIGAYSFRGWMEISAERFTSPLNGEEFVRTPNYRLMVPRVIRLLASNRQPSWTVQLTRRNVLARDGYRCQYCGKRFSPTSLSVDHVVPRSRRGKTVWTNVVAACRTCNTRKGHNLPREVGMTILRLPKPPRPNPLWTARNLYERHELWGQFLSESDLA